MTVHITYFVHGTTTDNEQHISSGWKDVELSERGVQQSIELREQTQNKTFDVVFTSDLQRAVNSAQLAWSDMYQIIQDARLRECNYGALNGGPSAIVEPMQESECIIKPFPEGESYEDVKARVAGFLEFLKKNYDNKHVAVVGHKAPQLSLEVLLNGKTWKQALADDWRKTKSWQPGWDYTAITIEREA
ncbi:MAG: histidine phosphatase family protein [Patescibacteria group bacterium]